MPLTCLRASLNATAFHVRHIGEIRRQSTPHAAVLEHETSEKTASVDVGWLASTNLRCRSKAATIIVGGRQRPFLAPTIEDSRRCSCASATKGRRMAGKPLLSCLLPRLECGNKLDSRCEEQICRIFRPKKAVYA